MALAMKAGPGSSSVPPLRQEVVSIIFRWLGRGLALLLFFFWGAFFIEHLNQWFVHPTQGGYPPLWVWAAMVFHLGILVGLLLALRWDRLGCAVTLAATVAFLFQVGFNWHKMPYVVLINLLPVGAFVVSRLLHTPAASAKPA